MRRPNGVSPMQLPGSAPGLQPLSPSPVAVRTGRCTSVHECRGFLKARVEEAFAAGLLRREGEKRHRTRVRQIDRRADEDALGPCHRLRAAAAARMTADGDPDRVDLAAELRRRCHALEFVEHRADVVRPIPVEVLEDLAGRHVGDADRLAQLPAARVQAVRVSDADGEVAGARRELAPLDHAVRRAALAVGPAVRPDDDRHRHRCAQRLADQQLDFARLAGVVGVENAALEGRESVLDGREVQAVRARCLAAGGRRCEGDARRRRRDDIGRVPGQRPRGQGGGKRQRDEGRADRRWGRVSHV